MANPKGMYIGATSLCMDCAMTTKGCPWAKSFKPLPDDEWEAEPIKKLVSSIKTKNGTFKKTYIDSYRVISCPHFRKYERMRIKPCDLL